ncbi:DoxX family protein [Streptomyces sp. NBC_01481]|uniref:DoxX family protein n=1 Tax=Streptomyces sp. NBC_01481 TaxID=2975869 RepID=UPI00225AF62F|nr:DoxX family protein [Streptomyces sp. NBC_01481]MCX4582912.1 DoxX family protein [Streptomyces sp. NBC_01481]
MSATAAVTTSNTAAVTTSGTTRSRRSHLAVRTLQIVLALFMAIPSAAPKLIGHSSAAESFDKIGFGDWFMYLTGGLELAGAIALVIPILSGLSALAFMGLMIGAFITQVTVFDGQYAITPVILFVIFGGIAWVRRNHTAELLALVRKRL